MIKVEKASGDHVVQPPCGCRQGHLELVDQGRAQMALEYILCWKLHHLSE